MRLPGVLVFADALRQGVEPANDEVRQSVVCKQRGPAKRPLPVGAEVVDRVVVSTAEVAAERDLILAVRPAHRVYELPLPAGEIVRVRGIDTEVTRHGDLPLIDSRVGVSGPEVREALRRLDRYKRAVRVVEAE